jgi:hypothetical protein
MRSWHSLPAWSNGFAAEQWKLSYSSRFTTQGGAFLLDVRAEILLDEDHPGRARLGGDDSRIQPASALPMAAMATRSQPKRE